MNWLTTLYAEQTTINDIIIFLFFGTVLTLFIALMTYLGVLITIWYWRYRGKYDFKTLLSPSISKIRANLTESLLGALAVLLLAFTLSAKHLVVEQVLNSDISTIESSVLSAALPVTDLVGALETEEGPTGEKIEAWLADDLQGLLGITSRQLVQPLLKNNLPDSAKWIMQAIADKSDFAKDAQLYKHLIIAMAVALLGVYILWLGRRRWRRIESKKSTSSITEILKRFSPPAICIPLVFVSAIELEDLDQTVERAVAVSAVSVIDEDAVSAALNDLAKEITHAKIYAYTSDSATSKTFTEDQQRHIIRHHDLLEAQAADMDGFGARFSRFESHMEAQVGLAEDLSGLQAEVNGLNTLEARLGTLEGRWGKVEQNLEGLSGIADDLTNLQKQVAGLTALEARLSTLEGGMSNLKNDMASRHERFRRELREAGRQLNALNQELKQLSQRVQQTGSQTGLLLVVAQQRYWIGPSNTNPTSAWKKPGIELYDLAPGRYQIVMGDSRVWLGNVRAGSAQSVSVGDRAFSTQIN